MTRSSVEDKERLLLETAIATFAQAGYWNTPTSLITKNAGVANGTLFVYFPTKADLINRVYLFIKREVAETLLADLSPSLEIREAMQQLWDRYLRWAAAYPQRFLVLRQLGTAHELSETVRAQANEPFEHMQALALAGIQSGQVADYPVEYVAQIFNAFAATTLEQMMRDPDTAHNLRQIGFEMFWKSVAA